MTYINYPTWPGGGQQGWICPRCNTLGGVMQLSEQPVDVSGLSVSLHDLCDDWNSGG